jgi:hypothetical protein
MSNNYPGWRLPATALFWTCVGVVFALPVLNNGPDWRAPLVQALTHWWAWGLLVPLIIALDVRLRFSSAEASLRLASQLMLGVVFCVIQVYVRALLAAPLALILGLDPWSRLAGIDLFTRSAGEGILWSMLVYGLIVGGWWAYQSHGRMAAAELRMERIERSYSEARLHALRLQLDPHFLFNTLNTISAQIQDEPAEARQMIEHLGDLLRVSLDPRSRHEIPLADELGFLDRYLSIQAIRFGDKLRVAVHVENDVRHAAVPSLLLQPLVENAIRHGISRRAASGSITISARQLGRDLMITVRDDGIGLGAEALAPGGHGLGLRLTRERLQGLHADGTTSLTLANHADGGAIATARLPLRLIQQLSPCLNPCVF